MFCGSWSDLRESAETARSAVGVVSASARRKAARFAVLGFRESNSIRACGLAFQARGRLRLCGCGFAVAALRLRLSWGFRESIFGHGWGFRRSTILLVRSFVTTAVTTRMATGIAFCYSWRYAIVVMRAMVRRVGRTTSRH